MKQKIKIIDKTKRNPIIIESEVNVRNLDHFAAQLKYKSTITKNKKKYTRKSKHKKKGDDYGE